MERLPTLPELASAGLPRDLIDLVAALQAAPVDDVAVRLAGLLVPGRLQAGDVVVGMCWATVDLERTIGAVALPFEPADPDLLLGGSAVNALIGSLTLLVAEPNTEGRLAAFLARYGEGLCAVYVERSQPPGTPNTNDRATALGRSGHLLTHARPWGPFAIAVERLT